MMVVGDQVSRRRNRLALAAMICVGVLSAFGRPAAAEVFIHGGVGFGPGPGWHRPYFYHPWWPRPYWGPSVFVGPSIVFVPAAPVVVGPPPIVYAEPPVVEAPPPIAYAEPPLAAVPASPPYQAANGQTCREYQATVRVGGVARPAYGTACLQPDGSWRIVN